MTKNIEWLKKELDDIENNTPALHRHDAIWMLDRVHELYNQLDEPEVLSQEWIAEHTWNNHYIGRPFVYVDDLQNLLVPKQEKVKVPKFVGVVIELYKKYGNSLTTLLADLAYHGELQVDSIDFVTSDTMFDWADENSDTVEEIIARAWLDGFTAEEEQKYYLKIGNLYLAEPLGNMTSDIVRMTRDKWVAYQFTDKKYIATHLDKFEGIEAVKVEELEE